MRMEGMGDLIRLADRRARRRPDATAGGPAVVRAEFFFDLASPFTYLAAERVDRAFDEVTWSPAGAGSLSWREAPVGEREIAEVAERAEQRAVALRLPLEWPERWPAPVPAAMRVAHHAAQA